MFFFLQKNDRPRQLPLNSGFMISKSRSPSRSRSHSSFSSACVLSSSTSSLCMAAPSSLAGAGTSSSQLTVPFSSPYCINEQYDTDSEAVVFTVKSNEDQKE